MQPHSNPDRHPGEVFHSERPHRAEEVQGHVGHLRRMPLAISFRKPGNNHIGIADGLDLESKDIVLLKGRWRCEYYGIREQEGTRKALL